MRINQMEQDRVFHKQIRKRLNRNRTTIIKWENIRFDNPRAFLDGLTQSVFINGAIDGDRYVNEILPTLTDVQGRAEETDDITTTALFNDNSG
ncbi:unnamed protein product [Rotaria sp. Silwood1]|nr:unnamed protein product [Rotaria sp. Silwood1]CAF4694868.1 unnamed protein product [Rotaria sp. Silwood1]